MAQLDFGELMAKIIKSENSPKELPLNVTSDTCGPEKIALVFPNSKYSEADDSEFVKKIKSFGLLDDTDLTFNGGYIFRKSGGFSIDNPYERDREYECAFVKKRDSMTKINLQNGTSIKFKVEYKTFIDNNMQINGLNQEDDIVLQSSYCNILYSYPAFQHHAVFTVHANDKITGFTKKELALKAMRLYHMLYYLSENYDIQKGHIVSTDTKREEVIFRPVCSDEREYTDNGLRCLQYNKDSDQWEFVCIQYI